MTDVVSMVLSWMSVVLSIWAFSYLGYRLGFSVTEVQWWHMPFLLTGILVSILVGMVTLYLVGRLRNYFLYR